MNFGRQAISLYHDDVDKNLPLKAKNQALGDACIIFDVLTQPSPLSGFRLLPLPPTFGHPAPSGSPAGIITDSLMHNSQTAFELEVNTIGLW